MQLVTIAIILLIALQIKHLVIDFPLQFPYQYLNKGTYGHPGGLLHSGMHGIGTFIVLIFWSTLYMAVLLAVIDALVHYHIDWAKVNINKKMGWGPTTHNEFWTLLGIDQFLHQLTYILIIHVALSY